MTTILTLSSTFVLGFATGVTTYHVVKKLLESVQSPQEQVIRPPDSAPAYDEIFGTPLERTPL